MEKIIFVVDDSSTNLSQAESALEDFYNVVTMSSAQKMFAMIEKKKPHLILLDIEMPDMNGFAAMEKLKANIKYNEIPVIFLTSKNDTSSEVEGLNIGAVDFISKPFAPSVLLRRVRTHIDIDSLIQERTDQLQHIRDNMIFVLSDMVENRDKGTGGHSERTTRYVKILINAMLKHGVYKEIIESWDVDVVSTASILHDIGKIVVSDVILNKPSRIDADEFAIMQTHATHGRLIIDSILERTGKNVFLEHAKLFAEYHHEKWNGSGYPHGLSGDDIPLQGRIMAFADVYDALVSDRPYKKGFPHERAIDIILSDSGTHFDPTITEVFKNIHEEFERVRFMQ